MPIYEYTCNDCRVDFELLVQGGQKAECPHCHGSKLTKQLSVIATPGSSQKNVGQVCQPMPGGACGMPGCGSTGRSHGCG